MAIIGLTAEGLLLLLRLTVYFVSLGCDDVCGGRPRRALPDSWEEEAEGPGVSHRIADAHTNTHVRTKDNAGAIQDEAVADPSRPFGSMLWQNTVCHFRALSLRGPRPRERGRSSRRSLSRSPRRRKRSRGCGSGSAHEGALIYAIGACFAAQADSWDRELPPGGQLEIQPAEDCHPAERLEPDYEVDIYCV